MVDFGTLMDLLNIQLEMIGRANPLTGLGLLQFPDVAADIWNLAKSIFDNFIGIFADLSQIIHIFDFLPSAWVTLFLVLLALVVALRIYAYFSDIEIGGFKI